MAETGWPAERIVRAAQDGDTESIAALVSGSYPHVMRFARTLCASPQDAEDAAQEALIILYRKVGMLRATAALSSWMFRIVRNECLRRARAAVRQVPLPGAGAADGDGSPGVGSAADVFAADVFAESPEEAVVRRLEAERIAEAVAALPDELRRVLIMRDVQGLPGRTVAASLGISVAAMKSRLHRARSLVQPRSSTNASLTARRCDSPPSFTASYKDTRNPGTCPFPSTS